MANKRPEFQENILLANLLAPVAYVDHMKSPMRLIAPFTDSIEVFEITLNTELVWDPNNKKYAR